jgi:flotillin
MKTLPRSTATPSAPTKRRFGIVTARPSEYLIHMRFGQIREPSSGQGASAFLWPWDSFALIPTSIDRLQFTADQVTRERVGVEVVGLAVYRIVEPRVAYRMLDFDDPAEATERLRKILVEMFVGATRRLVANLGIEEVMTHRKEALAAELMREISPVLEGRGGLEDGTDRGWGVVIDTIEVQNVRILSEAVFAQMQAGFRNSLERQSREAELDAKKAIAMKEAADRQALEALRLSADLESREQKAVAESRARKTELLESDRRAQQEAEAAERAKVAELERAQRELLAQESLAVARAEARRRELERQRELEALERARQAPMLEAKLAERRAEAELEQALAEARHKLTGEVSEARLREILLVETLPKVAEAFAGQIEGAHLYSFGGAPDPTAAIAQAVAQVLSLAKTVGLSLPKGD